MMAKIIGFPAKFWQEDSISLPRETRTSMSKTIIERMCSIAEKMRPEDEDSGMPITNMKKASADIKALAKTLELTDVQAVILTAIVQKSARYSVSGNDLADELGLEYLKFLTYNKETEGLRKRGYIRIDKDGDIVMPREVIRDFIELLDLLYQNPALSMAALMESDEFSYAKSEAVSDQAEESFAEFEI